MLSPKQVNYYDWEDFHLSMLDHLNKLLVQSGIDPIEDLHGGLFKDGKWVDRNWDWDDGYEYRNYWHVFIEIYGKRVRNNAYCSIPIYIDDESVALDKQEAIKQYGEWATLLVDAVVNMVKENNLADENGLADLLIHYCW